MPEMNPDPIEKLARFTPSSADHAELLLAAGRASAPTPWFWKAGLAASLLANAVCLGWLVFRAPEVRTITVPAEPTPILVVPRPEPLPISPTPDPWSVGSLNARGDLDRFPMPAIFDTTADDKPLTVLSARSGVID